MPNIIVPFQTVVDEQTAKLITQLKVEIHTLKNSVEGWKGRALSVERDLERHKENIAKIRKAQEQMEDFTRVLMDLCDITESDGWGG